MELKFNLIKIKFLFFLIFIYLLISLYIKNKYPTDNITLVTAFFKLETNRHTLNEYFIYIQNLLLINASFVFYIDKNISKFIMEKRPKIYENKTVWIETNFSDLFSFRHFKKDFTETYLLCEKKNFHSVPLYIIWAEKVKFLKRSIYNNYFNSKCFYWIDAGFFHDKNMSNYLYNWPSYDKCKKDPRVIINQVRNLSNMEINNIIHFDSIEHENFKHKANVGGGLFGGRSDYLIKFIYLYYKAIKLFKKKKKFIGSEQNIYTYVSFLHKDITNIINSNGNFHYFKLYLSSQYK